MYEWIRDVNIIMYRIVYDLVMFSLLSPYTIPWVNTISIKSQKTSQPGRFKVNL